MNENPSCAGFLFMLMVGIIVKVSVRVCSFPVGIIIEFSIFPCDGSSEECEFSVMFLFKGLYLLL